MSAISARRANLVEGPIDKLEFMWIAIAFVWSLVMFVMMVTGISPVARTCRTKPTRRPGDVRRQDAGRGGQIHGAHRHRSRKQFPVVKPPAGSGIYLIGRLWDWAIYELEKGKTYKLHLSAMDYMHGFRCSRRTSTSRSTRTTSTW